MTPPPPPITPLGESALSITLGPQVDLATHERVLRVQRQIRAARLPHVREIVPAAASLAVVYDACAVDFSSLARQLRTVLAQEPPPLDDTAGRTWEIAAVYDGPDLDAVARATGLPRDEVVRRHAARTYRVLMLGFSPGFAYLGPLDESLVLPRRATPRRQVPPGSIAIAGAQTAIYPLATPGGWHLLGRTDFRAFDPHRDPPVLFQPGDHVRFVPSS